MTSNFTWGNYEQNQPKNDTLQEDMTKKCWLNGANISDVYNLKNEIPEKSLEQKNVWEIGPWWKAYYPPVSENTGALMSSGSQKGSCSLPPAPWHGRPREQVRITPCMNHCIPRRCRANRKPCPDLPAYSQTASQPTGQTCFLLSSLEPCMG